MHSAWPCGTVTHTAQTLTDSERHGPGTLIEASVAAQMTDVDTLAQLLLSHLLWAGFISVTVGPVLNFPKLFGPIPSEFGEIDGQHRAPVQTFEHATIGLWFHVPILISRADLRSFLVFAVFVSIYR